MSVAGFQPDVSKAQLSRHWRHVGLRATDSSIKLFEVVIVIVFFIEDQYIKFRKWDHEIF